MQRGIKKLSFPVAGILCLAAAIWAVAFGADTAQQDRIKHGEYLVRTGSCGDCHTPWKLGANGPEPDSTRLLSGHPQDMALPPAPQPQGPWIASVTGTFTGWAGPWGVSFSRNLTPDKETGLGAWTEENFIATLRTGRELGKGRQLMPPMPWPSYANFTDEDLKSIWAYLQSIPAVKNKVPENLPPAAPPAEKK